MASLLIELLQFSLGTREKLSRIPKEGEWMPALNEMYRQMIIGVFADGLERLPQEYLPSKLTLLPSIGSIQKVEESTKLNMERSREMTTMAHSVGFKSCVLKGVAIAQYYPNPLRRQCGDIDLWVSGQRKDVMTWLRSRYEIDHSVWHHAKVEIFDDLLVEIHFHPAWLWNPLHNRRLQRFFESQKEDMMVVDEKLGFACPSVEFDVVLSLVHAFRHFIAEGLTLKYMVDFFYIIRKLREEDDALLHHTVYVIHQLGLQKFAGAVMWVLTRICGMPKEELLCESDEKEGRLLLKEIKKSSDLEESNKKDSWYADFRRFWIMTWHYPAEMFWRVPWRIWHRCWRVYYRNGE